MKFIHEIENILEILKSIKEKMKNEDVRIIDLKADGITGNVISVENTIKTIKHSIGKVTVTVSKIDKSPNEIEVSYDGESVHLDTGDKRISSELESIRNILV